MVPNVFSIIYSKYLKQYFKRNLWWLVMHDCKLLHGGDPNENDNFKEGTLVMHGYTFLHGSELNEDIIIRGGN